MKFENQLGCQYCGAGLGVENGDTTEKKVAMLIVHFGVCRNQGKWPAQFITMNVPQRKEFLTELFDTAEPLTQGTIGQARIVPDTTGITNAVGAAELQVKLAQVEAFNTFRLKMAIGLAKVEQYYQRELDNVNADTMCEGPFDGNEADWEEFSTFCGQQGGLTVTLGFGQAVEMTPEERAENELRDQDYEQEQAAYKTDGALRSEMMALLNRFSREAESNTPDFILADYLAVCLKTFEVAVTQRDEWYGISPSPGRPFKRLGEQKYPGK